MSEQGLDPDEAGEIDLITLRPDRLLNGGSPTDQRLFDSLESALRCAAAMSVEQQERSWIVMGSKRLSLEEARALGAKCGSGSSQGDAA